MAQKSCHLLTRHWCFKGSLMEHIWRRGQKYEILLISNSITFAWEPVEGFRANQGPQLWPEHADVAQSSHHSVYARYPFIIIKYDFINAEVCEWIKQFPWYR